MTLENVACDIFGLQTIESKGLAEDWLGRRDSNPNNLLQRQVSYR